MQILYFKSIQRQFCISIYYLDTVMHKHLDTVMHKHLDTVMQQKISIFQRKKYFYLIQAMFVCPLTVKISKDSCYTNKIALLFLLFQMKKERKKRGILMDRRCLSHFAVLFISSQNFLELELIHKQNTYKNVSISKVYLDKEQKEDFCQTS